MQYASGRLVLAACRPQLNLRPQLLFCHSSGPAGPASNFVVLRPLVPTGTYQREHPKSVFLARSGLCFVLRPLETPSSKRQICNRHFVYAQCAVNIKLQLGFRAVHECSTANEGTRSYAAQGNAVQANTARRAAHPAPWERRRAHLLRGRRLAPSNHSSVSSIFKIDLIHLGVDCLPLRVAPGISRSPATRHQLPKSPTLERISRQCT